MEVEKKPLNPEIGKAKILETLKAFQVGQQQPKEEKPVEVIPGGEVDIEPIETADAEVLHFVEALKAGRRKSAVDPPVGSLDAIALKLLKLAFAGEPAWEERDRDVAQEMGLSPAARVIRCIAMVYDQQLHMNLLHGYDFLETSVMPSAGMEPGLGPRMEAECPQCHKTFTRKVPGQICCSNECGIAHFPPPVRKEPVFDDNFERFIESQNNPNRPPVDPIRSPGMPVSGLVR